MMSNNMNLLSVDLSGLLEPLSDQSLLDVLHASNIHFDSTQYALAWTVVGAAMLVLNNMRYKDLPQTTWRPGAAWTRALVYFSGCNIFAATTGTTNALLSQPFVTSTQIADPTWQLGALGCTIYILVAYWGLWSRMTLTFDRQLYLGAALLFGLLWGCSTGQLLLSFYHLCNTMGMEEGWARYLLAYSFMGGWQYLIQDYWWDIYISPEHDTPKSIIVKTAACHIPNVAICLFFLNSYGNYFMFLFWQTLALVAASIFQKFPAPWAEGEFDAPMTQPGVFGLPRGLGYIIDEEEE
ncbi:MAG: hypothetical protein SGILL_002401 [Bacillariaceae sp.]